MTFLLCIAVLMGAVTVLGIALMVRAILTMDRGGQ